MSTEKTAWGYQSDNDESLKSKGSGKFGLNTGKITLIAYKNDAGKDGSAADAVDIHFETNGKEFRMRVYDITGDLFKGQEKVSPGQDGYEEVYEAEKKQKTALVIHAIKAVGVTDAQIQTAIKNGGVVDFATWAQAVCSTVPANYATLPVDAFLEYQWAITEGNDRTFLQLAKNMKGGRFLSPAIKPVGSWKPIYNAIDGLEYVDDAGNKHPFDRSANFMESFKAILQQDGEPDKPAFTASETSATVGASSAKPVSEKW